MQCGSASSQVLYEEGTRNNKIRQCRWQSLQKTLCQQSALRSKLYKPLELSHPSYSTRISGWGFERLTALGNLELLNQPLVGVASSRQCPARLIIAAQDWAKAAREQGLALVGGFHSPVEEEVLRVALRGSAGVVFCLA